MVKDNIGNELREGDLVYVQLERPFLIGRVSKIEEGGIIAPGSRNSKTILTPGQVTVTVMQPVPVDPRNGEAGAIMKLCDPVGAEAASNLLKM